MVSISGAAFRAIERAVTELDRHGIEVEQCQIVVEFALDSISVSFRDPHWTPMRRGSGPNLTGFDVELKPDTFEILRSGFSK
jgi:hypothetical protein